MDPQAEAIANSRPPDRIEYSPWKPIYGPTYKKMVATEWTLFKVLEYKEVEVEPIVAWERKRIEVWEEKGRMVAVPNPDYNPAKMYPYDIATLTITSKYIEPKTVAKVHTERRSATP